MTLFFFKLLKKVDPRHCSYQIWCLHHKVNDSPLNFPGYVYIIEVIYKYIYRLEVYICISESITHTCISICHAGGRILLDTSTHTSSYVTLVAASYWKLPHPLPQPSCHDTLPGVTDSTPGPIT